MKEENNIQNHGKDCLPSEVLLKYVQGELTGIEKNLVERHLSSCEMCSDELEGISLMRNPETIDGISLELNQRIDALAAKQKMEMSNLGLYLRVAASLALLLGVSTIIYFTAFRKTSSLVPSYALMETKVIPPAHDSSNNLITKSIPKEERLENQKFDANRKSEERGITEKRIANTEEALKYVAPAVDDSVLESAADEVIIQEKEFAIVDSNVRNKQKPYEVGQMTARDYAQLPASVSTEKKNLSASGALAKAKSISGKETSEELIKPEPYNTRKETSITLISNGMYEDALAILNGLRNNYPKNDSILFYASICYYHLNSLKGAVKGFEKFTHQPLSAFYHEGKWYYALCYIRLDRLNEADSILQSIVDEDSPYSNDAKQRLDRLRDSIK